MNKWSGLSLGGGSDGFVFVVLLLLLLLLLHQLQQVLYFFFFIMGNICFNYFSFLILYHNHVMPLARISLTLSRHFSLSFIDSGRSSGLHPESSHSCCTYVRAGRPAFARPYVGSDIIQTSLSFQISESLLLRYYIRFVNLFIYPMSCFRKFHLNWNSMNRFLWVI